VTRFFQNIRGVIFFAGLTANTFFWFIPIIVFAVAKLLLPITILRHTITRILMAFGENWVSVNGWLMQYAGSVRIESNGGDRLKRDGWYFIIANHQTWIDIFILQAVFNRRVPFLKFFLKQELMWFPLLGIAWWALDMPFMKRFSPSYLSKYPNMRGKDLEMTRSACNKFRDTPTSVLNFIEGTRFSEQKRADRKSPYNKLLQPRAGGFAITLSSMGDLFNSIVDVTLIYPDNSSRFWDMCCGKDIRVIVEIHERLIERWLIDGDYESDRAFRKELHSWLTDLWSKKDVEIVRITKENTGNINGS